MTACVAGAACVGFDPTTKTSATVDAPPLCAGCLAVAERDIRALIHDYAGLEQLLPRGASAMSTRVGGSTDPEIPLDLGVDALQRSIAWALTTWEPAVREAAGLSDPPAGAVRDGFAVAAAVAVIAPRVNVLAAVPPTWCYADGLEAGPLLRNGFDAVGSLRSLHRNARNLLGLTRLVHRLPGECSNCGAEALERANGSDTVGCAVCGERWAYDDYRRYVGLILTVLEPKGG